MTRTTSRSRTHHGRKHTCVACRAHRAVFHYRGAVRADPDHNICPRCYRTHQQQLLNWMHANL